MALHHWWDRWGRPIASDKVGGDTAAAGLVSAAEAGRFPGVEFVECREGHDPAGIAVHLTLEVERPQDLAYPIRGVEPVAILFPANGGQPLVYALRDDFPDTLHQNWAPTDGPCSLCVDDRPWPEARLTYRPVDFVRRVQIWLSKAARGDLHDPAQPLDPLFFASLFQIVIPPEALVVTPDPVDLVDFLRSDNPTLILTQVATAADGPLPGFNVIFLRAQPQRMARLRRAPLTLAELAQELQGAGLDLDAELHRRLLEWVGLGEAQRRRLSSRIAIVVAFPVVGPDGRSADDLRAFITFDSAGKIGERTGLYHSMKSAGVGQEGVVVRAFPKGTPNGEPSAIQPAQVYRGFDRTLAAAIANHPPELRRVVLVGAGSLGSQVALNLAREGAFRWSVADNDVLLPHNLARHSLMPTDVGAPKARALARQLSTLLGEDATAFVANIFHPDDALVQALARADIILDASASVAVSRYLADLGAAARRICVFFNPTGTAVVLLAEDKDRSTTLRDLEAQYHALLLNDPDLSRHLASPPGLRYSGSCREPTNRIPASRAALLAAIAATGIDDVLQGPDAAIRIWSTTPTGEVRLAAKRASPVMRFRQGEWTVIYSQSVLDILAGYRALHLPQETGGVLLGIVDTAAHSIHVVQALPQPVDSVGTPIGFERGVVGLQDEVRRALDGSLNQIGYVGEWHSHPSRSSAAPSITDINQMAWLSRELDADGLPVLMAIAADNGRFAFLLGGTINGTPNGHHKQPERSEAK